jgi:hypothetical protein
LALKALKNTAPAHDLIINIFFSKAYPLFKQELLSLVNMSWISDVVPDTWKHGIVPIPKSQEQVNGYQPITLLFLALENSWSILSNVVSNTPWRDIRFSLHFNLAFKKEKVQLMLCT